MLILTIIAMFVVLVASELWWHKHQPNSELSRKFIHITIGSFAAFWPFFLSWNQILFLGVAFVGAVCVSRYLDVFKAIHSVERPTWGEVYFAIAVGLLALLTHDRYIYMAALLTMSLADGLAAVIGVRYGKDNSYKIFRHIKSVIGSLTFFVITASILVGYAVVSHAALRPLDIFALSLMATAVENIAVFGLDNLLVPLLIALAVQHLG
jgi:phytol kinase